MSIKRAIKLMAMLAGSFLYAAQAQSALVATGGAAYGEPSGGVTSPIFTGSISAEVFDSAGGDITSFTGEAVPVFGSDYTFVFQLVLNPDAEGEIASLLDITFGTYQLGTGDTGQPAGSFSFTGPPSSGGVLSGDVTPTYSSTTNSAIYTFGAGWTEPGSTAATATVWFTSPYLDLTSSGTSNVNVPLGDQIGAGIATTTPTSVDTQIVLTAVPVPAAVWLFGSGLLGLTGLARRKRS